MSGDASESLSILYRDDSLIAVHKRAGLLTLVAPGEERCALQLTSRFLPKGLGGILYWYAFLPVHRLVFKGMLAGMARAAGCALMEGPEPFAPEEKEVCFLPRDERNAVRERRNI